MKKIDDYNHTGIRREFFADGDRLVVKSTQDVEGILKDNKRKRLDNPSGYTPSGEFMEVAHIPNIVIEQWLKEGINVYDKNDMPKILEKLQDPDWQKLRTNQARLI